jgi:hypothetical protein
VPINRRWVRIDGIHADDGVLTLRVTPIDPPRD